MTSTEHRPPLQAVYPPQHDDRTAWQRDRQRFAAFLTAKDLVLGYTRTATEGADRLAARLHLDGVFRLSVLRPLPGLDTVSVDRSSLWRAPLPADSAADYMLLT